MHQSAKGLETFAKCFPTNLVPRRAIQACHVYMHMFRSDRTSLLLLVDEVRKTMDGSSEMVTLMGEVLSKFRYDQVNIVSTTLNSLAFQQARTSSGRPLMWASLDSLRQDQAEDMFLQAVQVQKDAASLLQELPVVPLSVMQRRTFQQPSASKGGPTPVEVMPGHLRIENTESCHVHTGLRDAKTAIPKLSMLSLLCFAKETPLSPIAECINLLAEQEEMAVTTAAGKTLNSLEGGCMYELRVCLCTVCM